MINCLLNMKNRLQQSFHFNKLFLIYATKLIILYYLFYFTTQAIIGLSATSGLYNNWIAEHFDYISWLRRSLIKGTAFFVHFFGYHTIVESGFLIRIINGRGVIVALGCAGYGVLSFWLAYVLSSNRNIFQSIIWILIGFCGIWIVNVCRIGIFLMSINEHWSLPLGLDHHTWFNVVAYTLIIAMIFLKEKMNTKNDRFI